MLAENIENRNVGVIIAISELNVKVLLNDNNIKINDILYTIYKGEERSFEVVQIDDMIATTIPFESVNGLKKGIELGIKENGLQIQYSDEILGKVFNSYGKVINNKEIQNEVKRNVYDRKVSLEEININDFYWGLTNKFKLEIGLKNFINLDYPVIIWFNKGIYCITGFNTSYSVNNY